jgi:hypothetical protein
VESLILISLQLGRRIIRKLGKGKTTKTFGSFKVDITNEEINKDLHEGRPTE